jgi:hypothetical protein
MVIRTKTMSVTEFKATCLSVFDELENRQLDRVVVTRRGKRVGEVHPVKPTRPVSIIGANVGGVEFVEGVDLTEPILDFPADWPPAPK